MKLLNDKVEVIEVKERTVARQLARELTAEEIATIAGAKAVSYSGTGCPESDCD